MKWYTILFKIEDNPFGPGYIKIAHGPDGYVNIQAIIDSAKIYALTAVNYLNFF